METTPSCGARLHHGLRTDKGESVNTLIADPPPGARAADSAAAGRFCSSTGEFHESFAGPERRAGCVHGRLAGPWGVDALAGTISEPAWRTKPSWYLVATEDRMIPPPAQREMSARAGSTVVEVAGSHSIYVSNPEAVADLIKKAASELG
jgi:pimeloyl-ACP methyl ester carboxylesterase